MHMFVLAYENEMLMRLDRFELFSLNYADVFNVL